jgi:hypothetical protein
VVISPFAHSVAAKARTVDQMADMALPIQVIINPPEE